MRHSVILFYPRRSTLLSGAVLCLILSLLLGVFLVESVHAQNKLTAAEAKDHIGETASKCSDLPGVHSWQTYRTIGASDLPAPNVAGGETNK